MFTINNITTKIAITRARAPKIILFEIAPPSTLVPGGVAAPPAAAAGSALGSEVYAKILSISPSDN
ncbi:hypothetical protein D3C86_476660 [compost metagenome]